MRRGIGEKGIRWKNRIWEKENKKYVILNLTSYCDSHLLAYATCSFIHSFRSISLAQTCYYKKELTQFGFYFFPCYCESDLQALTSVVVGGIGEDGETQRNPLIRPIGTKINF